MLGNAAAGHRSAKFDSAELLLENGILVANVLNDFLSLSIEPPGENIQQHFPRLQKTFDRRHGGSEIPKR